MYLHDNKLHKLSILTEFCHKDTLIKKNCLELTQYYRLQPNWLKSGAKKGAKLKLAPVTA